jgi:hypothetical protein
MLITLAPVCDEEGERVEPWSRPLQGRLDELEIDSEALKGNHLGDPYVRPLWVYVPPAGVADPDRALPSLYVIQGFTGQIDMWHTRAAGRLTMIEDVDALFSDPAVPPSLVVYVDCWTSLGGSQFLDSPGTGRYHTYLCEDVVRFVDGRYATLDDPAHRGIAGKSSGGYGAMITPMLRPDRFGGLATHAGDALFELCYLPEFAACARTLRDDYQGSWDRFWADYTSRPAYSKPSDGPLVNEWAMAACYSADPDGRVQLPFEAASGRLVPEVWERWLALDPVRMVPGHADALRGLRAIWIDAGKRDEWWLDLGAEAFRRELEQVGVTDVHFELFDAGHGGIGYRYPPALRYLAERLAPA